MRLRAQVERMLPLRDGEVRLSTDARETVFRGTYFLPSEVTGVEVGANDLPETRDVYPYRVQVTRTEKNGTKKKSGNLGFYNPMPKSVLGAVEELKNPDALRRATRVEKVARGIKKTAVLATIAAVLTVSVFTFNDAINGDEPAPPPEPTEDTPPLCGEVITGGETLIPLGEQDVVHVQAIGGVVCNLDSQDYLVIGE